MIIPVDKLKIGQHIFATSANDIQIISKLLISYGITHFAYQRKHRDGSVELLGTHPEFTEKFINEKLYATTFCGNIDDYVDCYAFWDDIECNEIRSLAKETYHLYNGLVIIKKHENYVDFYYFASKPNTRMKSFYLNNMDVLENFILYFHEVANDLLKKTNRQRILYPEANDFSLLTSKEFQTKNHSIKQQSNELIFNLNHLTKKERICSQYIAQGLSSKEIAQLLHISHRTVEKHINSIKIKTNCESILKLVSYLARRL